MTNLPESAIATGNQNSAPNVAIDSYDLALLIATAAEEKKAGDIVLLKVSEVSYLADYFVIMTGFSRTQLNAIAESIEDHLEEKLNLFPSRVSGKREGDWIVMDYADVIAHIFLPEERDFYDLEAFWGHAERIEFSQSS